jgi:hypothetical protein
MRRDPGRGVSCIWMPNIGGISQGDVIGTATFPPDPTLGTATSKLTFGHSDSPGLRVKVSAMLSRPSGMLASENRLLQFMDSSLEMV